MARKATVQIEGAKRLRKELKRAGIDLSDLRAPHFEAANIVSNKAKPNTPRRTGALADSIRPGASRTAGVIRAGGARVPYAGPIHWGWKAHGIEPNPWLTETAQDSEEEWVNVFWQELETVLGHIAGG